MSLRATAAAVRISSLRPVAISLAAMLIPSELLVRMAKADLEGRRLALAKTLMLMRRLATLAAREFQEAKAKAGGKSREATGSPQVLAVLNLRCQAVAMVP